MGKHSTKEAYYQRLQELGQVGKPSISESNNRTLGTLIDYKRASDGVAYGIIKESHNYYIKKAGTKENLDVSDFVYIGGLANVTQYQYKKLSEADKQRNMILHTINEAYSQKVSKTGSKKKMLTEDNAGEEIEMAASKVDDLESATAMASEIPAEEPAPDFSGEPMGGEEPSPEGGDMPIDEPAPEGGEEGAPMGDDMPIDEPAPEGDDMPVDEPAPEGDEDTDGGAELAPDDDKSLTTKEIEKNLGKLTNKIRGTELTDSQVKSYVNSFLSAFKGKFSDVEIEDRKEMANKILKVVPDEDIDDLDVRDEEEIEEVNSCDECGSFVQYAESRGYTAESIMECGEEEMANLVGGYATAHDDGQNEGDHEAVALFIKIMPQVLDILKNEYGHEEYADQLTPYAESLTETSEEDVLTKINELWVGEGVSDPANVEVQPNMIKEDGEDFEDDVDVNSDTPEKEVDSVSTEDIGFSAGFEPMGGGVVKPDGAATTTVEVTKDSVNVTMNESEKKIRKYIRNRLEEKAGIRKSSLNESQKSAKLKKLDEMIDSQLKLYESVVAKNGGDGVNESSRGRFEKINPNDFKQVNDLLFSVYPVLRGPMAAAIQRALKTMSQEEKYQLLKQYFDNNGGTLRIANVGGATKVVYASQSVKDKATPSKFTSGGTQGKTRLGGV